MSDGKPPRDGRALGSLAAGFAALALCCGVACGASALDEPSIEIPPAQPTGTRRPITLGDILSVREISEPTLSPDGTRVAYLVKQAFLRCNCTRTAIYVESTSGVNAPHKLDEEPQISRLRWTPDGRHLSFLSARDGTIQLWWVSPDGGGPRRVFLHRPSSDPAQFANALLRTDAPVGVAGYEWSPDGRYVAFSAPEPIDPESMRQAETDGIRYDDARMSVMDLNAGKWNAARRSAQLWIYDVRTHGQRLLWRTPRGTWAHIGTLAWSPTGGQLALSFPDGADQLSRTAGIVDVNSGRFRNIGGAGGIVSALSWSPDGRAIVVASRRAGDSGDARLTISGITPTEARESVGRLTPGATPTLFWVGRALYFVSDGIGFRRENAGLYRVRDTGGKPARITSLSAKVSDCSPPTGHRVACVWQTPAQPPRVAMVDLETGSVKRLSDVNPELASVQLGPVEELHWANRFGETTNGYLVLPLGAPARARRPLVIMGYGFDGDFVAQANWALTSYPAQAFARDGFAVLLINPPKWEEWIGDNFSRGSRAWGYGPLASLQAIIDRLSNDGIIDAAHVGFMGHSWGGFWVQFAVSHSGLVDAAELHNGGTLTEPGSYSDTGMDLERATQDHFMGGGPYPPTLRNYLGFSATLTAGHVKIPILIENDATEATFELEYFTALRAHGVPVDFIVYPDDGHVFTMPSHRMISMQRNLEWFEFWLLGTQSSDPGAADRYAVWRAMRKELAALHSERPH